MARPDFTLEWSSDNTPDPVAPADYGAGWTFIGPEPPLKSQFDYFQNLADRRLLWIGSQIPTSGGVLANAGDLMTVGGTADAVTLTTANTAPAEAYTSGSKYRFTAAQNSTGAVTVDVDGLGAKTLNIRTGGLISGNTYEIVYNGTSFDVYTSLYESVTKIDSISDLEGFTPYFDGQTIVVNGYHSGSQLGGGVFVKANGRHDGGTFIDPNRTFPASWSDEVAKAAWYADSGLDVDGWKRVDDTLTVGRFGAKGIGATSDDTKAIQKAIDAGEVLRGQPVYVEPNRPAQYYAISSSLVALEYINLIGSGWDACSIIGDGFTLGVPMLHLNNIDASPQYGSTIENLTFRTLDNQAAGIQITSFAHLNVKNVRIRGCSNSIIIEGTSTFLNYFENVSCFETTGKSIWFKGYLGGGGCAFYTCDFSGNDGFFVDSASSISGLNLIGCNFEQCLVSSMYVEGNVRGLLIDGPRTEGCQSTDFFFRPTVGNKVNGLTITGGYFQTDGVANDIIQIGGDSGTVEGFNISGNYIAVAQAGAYFVNFNGGGNHGLVSGNKIDQDAGVVNTFREGVTVENNANSAGKLPESPVVTSYTAISGSTPDVSQVRDAVVNNLVITNMTDMLNEQGDQVITLYFQNANTNMRDFTTTGNFRLKGGIDVTPPADSIMTFRKLSTVTTAWIEVSRSF